MVEIWISKWYVNRQTDLISTFYTWVVGFIQGLKSKIMARSIGELGTSVEHTFYEYLKEKTTSMFLTLKSMYESSMSVNSGKYFKFQNGGKVGLIDSQKLHYSLACDDGTYKNALQCYEDKKETRLILLH